MPNKRSRRRNPQRQLPQATIAAIEGRARGVGNEFIIAWACTLRTKLAEVGLDIDGATAERIGCSQRTALFPPADIAAAKREVDAVGRPSKELLIRKSQDVFDALVGTPVAQALEKFIALTYNQSIGPLELSYSTEVFELFE
ncbi:hypothetical protein B0H14DRAFT_3423186 [Mycena olivaceomarginata]|nr:hypothetical protein B0H14DRAFT_3423186 [Mycena olivaceomarginata]